ncbi:hypothetical protein [Lignipirellula cremea]|uniref:DUF4198 domain-containing protein n=1 Tax=Lignipirellula cremea TaxID=2528010 RepID=A0A518DYR8_9BACT|nr:hypothetical protein [Lignipirellula cremea]QDU96993.1 hypothetical protein Pla8534_48180 [Lignipirellula cremea]
MKLIYRLMLAGVLACAARPALAAPPLDLDFAKPHAIDGLLKDPAGRLQIESVDGAAVLVADDTTVRFQDIAVKPNGRYVLSLTAGFQGNGESIEENPHFEVFNRLGQTGANLPSREIRFLDASGKSAGQTLRYGLPFKSMHDYVDEFYAPAGAVTARIAISTGKANRLLLAKAVLAESRETETLNINPTFALGPVNYAGWTNISAGGQLIQQDGKTIFDTKYGSSGQPIPLTQSGTYAISAKATGNGYNSIVIIRVYDADGKELMRASTRQYGPPTYFVPPADAVYASFLVYSCLLEEVRLQRVGDVSAIEALRKK